MILIQGKALLCIFLFESSKLFFIGSNSDKRGKSIVNTEISVSNWLYRQTGKVYAMKTVPTQTPKGTLLHWQISCLSVPINLKDPKVLF